MIDAIIFIAVLVFAYFLLRTDKAPAPPTNTETITCVRVKQVTPAGTINYLCEVRK